MRWPQTDVLVVGSGLAGLYAAIHCRRQGMGVTVCSKSKPGLGSCSTISQGIFRTSGDSFTPADHKQLTLEAGRGLNQEGRLDILIQNGDSDVGRLQEFGVNLGKGPAGYGSRPEKIGREGLCITKPLSQYARSIGVDFRSPFFAWRIATAEGRALGVWGWEPGREQPVFLASRCVILATGGAGALYARTDNPQGMTGDGYALAFQAGVPLMDMEFVQFYPLCMGRSRTSRLLPPSLGEVGRLENVRGEDLVSKYGISSRPVALAARDELCQAMAQEVASGRGFPEGGLRLKISREDTVWERTKESFGLESMADLRSWTEKHLEGDRCIPVMPAAHFSMGGLVPEGGCSTAVKGLFAAGEVVGGLHGANRYGGNALTETAVFGRLAAEEAVRVARESRDPDWSLAEEPDLVPESAYGGKTEGCSQLKRRLQDLMWQKAGIIRSEEQLRSALEELEAIGSGISHLTSGAAGGLGVLELSNMHLVAETIVRSALAREESRGSHYRSDYPRTKDALAKHIVLRKEEQEVRLSWEN